MSIPNLTHHSVCRYCRSNDLHLVIDLNDQPPANSLVSAEQLESEQRFPLKLYVCKNCQLTQLLDVVNMDVLFQGYVYWTGGAGATTPKHFTDYAQSIIERFALNDSSRVIELGSNDGLLLQAFKELGVTQVIGVDPAHNVADHANKQGIFTIAEPWSEELAKRIAQEHGKADVIIGNNVVAHIDDHHDLFAGVAAVLAPRGTFVFEAPYLIDMFENLTFDTIYHEHLSCLSLRPIISFLESSPLEVFDIELKPVHGMSMRTFIGFKDAHTMTPAVAASVAKELALGMDTTAAYDELAARIKTRKQELLALLAKLKQEGKRVAGYGAPAKSSTIINYLGVGPEHIEYLTEELPTKVGKLSPGSHIPLVHVNEARINPPDYFVLFAWNYAESILNDKEKALREAGVKFIVPVGPELTIV